VSQYKFTRSFGNVAIWSQKPDTDRPSNGDFIPRWFKRTGFLVNSENDDTVFALVGDEAEPARRVDVEVPGRFDIGGLMLDESQCPFGRIDPVNNNTVMPTVRTVEKLPVWMHTYFSA